MMEVKLTRKNTKRHSDVGFIQIQNGNANIKIYEKNGALVITKHCIRVKDEQIIVSPVAHGSIELR